MIQQPWRREPPLIDIDINGRFPPKAGASLPAQIASVALAVAAVAAAVVLVALALWLIFWTLVVVVPIVLAAGVIAWAAWRYQLWRARQSSFGRGPGGDWGGFRRR